MSHPVATFATIEEAARFAAELIRQGIMFHVTTRAEAYIIVMTGY